MWWSYDVILFCCLLTGVFSDRWSYTNEKDWPGICKSGKVQSPIALDDDTATLKEFHVLSMQGYGQMASATVKNNGHSEQLNLENLSPPRMHGGGLPGTYQLDHLHFHWQSEHTINGNRFPLELHLVHFEAKHRNFSEAVKHPLGVAVLSVLFYLSADDNEHLQPLIAILDKIKNDVNKPEKLDKIQVKHLLPKDRGGFFRYHGSLTTPGCNEGVVWTVFTDTLPISKNQVESFSKMKSDENVPLTKNYRSLQPINDRPLYLRSSPIELSSSSSTLAQSTFLLITVCYCLSHCN